MNQSLFSFEKKPFCIYFYAVALFKHTACYRIWASPSHLFFFRSSPSACFWIPTPHSPFPTPTPTPIPLVSAGRAHLTSCLTNSQEDVTATSVCSPPEGHRLAGRPRRTDGLRVAMSLRGQTRNMNRNKGVCFHTRGVCQYQHNVNIR